MGLRFLTLLAAVAVILTISRGGLAALCAGPRAHTLALLPRHFSARNIAFLLMGTLAGAAILFVSLDTLMKPVREGAGCRRGPGLPRSL
jgi:hypothetical protein